MTGPLTDRQVEDLVALVQAAIDARIAYAEQLHAPMGVTIAEQADWFRRVDDAFGAALDAQAAAVAAIRALRGAS